MRIIGHNLDLDYYPTCPNGMFHILWEVGYVSENNDLIPIHLTTYNTWNIFWILITLVLRNWDKTKTKVALK